MPQMAPLFWTLLLMLFYLTLALFMVKLYFLTSPPCPSNSATATSLQKTPWQW